MPGIACTRLLAAAGALWLLLPAPPAAAHGKDVEIALTCVAPDPARPLAKICTAFLRYADGDPVADARLQMAAQREGKDEAPLGPVAFTPLNREGAYSAGIAFPAYGRWRMRLQVRGPGKGEAERVEDLLPPLPGAVPLAGGRLQVTLQFGLRDVWNLTLRITHLLAAVAWFAITFLVLILLRITPADPQRRLLARVAALFPWVAGGSLLLIALTGTANALYNAPTRAPGVLAPEAIARLPFGRAYLAAFAVKMALTAGILAATAFLGLALRQAWGASAPLVAGAACDSRRLPGPESRVALAASASLVLGVLTVASVVVLGYLHMITHVAAAGAR